MVISVFGLGYVGCVSLACLANSGHDVIGVDVNKTKLDQIANGFSTIYEPGLDELMAEVHKKGRVRTTDNVDFAVRNSDVSFITVGTPNTEDGDLDLSHIFAVVEQIGECIKSKQKFHCIAIRSTIKPGTCRKVVEKLEIVSGKKDGIDFAVVANPEFLREGSAIKDYNNPPYVLIGSIDGSGVEIITSLYANLNTKIINIDIKTAEIIKYINNSWHALKVVFGNEVGSICKAMGINSQEVIDIFVQDTSLNISPAYMRPGFAYGGSCLPKDLSALVTLAKKANIKAPLLESVSESNDEHIRRAVAIVKATKHKKIGFIGLSFKENTDDVRNSPILKVIQTLAADGYEIKILDPIVYASVYTGRNNVSTSSILGETLQYLTNSEEVLIDHAELIVIAKNDSLSRRIIEKLDDKICVIDFVYTGTDFKLKPNYTGIAW